MAVTSVAMGKIEMQRRKGQPIPSGWALGKNGDVTTDAAEAIQVSRLLPLGGSEVTSGYKGIKDFVQFNLKLTKQLIESSDDSSIKVTV